MKKAFASLSVFIVATTAIAADTAGNVSFDYMPQIHGTIRTRYEMSVYPDVLSRFQVRTARLAISGQAAPFIDYFMQTDLDDRGQYKFLDAWGRIAFTPSVKVSLGQMRVPFSVDASRAPHQYYFANRSTVSKLVGLQRSVGGKIAVAVLGNRLTAETGVFNTHSITAHNVWERTMVASVKSRYTFRNMFIEGGFESARPDSVRINQIDATVNWSSGRWMAEGEYLYKHYTRDRFKPTHAWNVMACYTMPINMPTFNRLSIQSRYDGITDNSQGVRNSDGKLYMTQPRHQRATIGATLSYIHPKVRADLRLDYEKYFYPRSVLVPVDDHDKLLLELVIRF